MSATTTVRRLPLPACEPPYDDDPATPDRHTASGVPMTQGTLALAFTLPSGVAAEPPVPRTLQLVPGGDPTTGKTQRDALSDPRIWAGRLVQAILEVLNGDRPPAQLVRWTSAEIYADMQRRVHARARLRTPTLHAGGRATVRSVHVCQPATDIAEIAVTVLRAGRMSAVALRLEGVKGRWQCTALELG